MVNGQKKALRVLRGGLKTCPLSETVPNAPTARIDRASEGQSFLAALPKVLFLRMVRWKDDETLFLW